MRRLITRYSTLTLALLGAVAVAASAQERVREREQRRERERTFVYSFGPETFRFDMRRGRMGINVDLRPDAARDSLGARVAGVTPGGAAERAGVQAGDVITRVNGLRLNAAAANERELAEDGDEQSRPALRLLRIASRLDPGDTVRLDVRRGSQNQTFTFVAEESDMDRMVIRERRPMLGAIGEGEGPGPMQLMIYGGPSDLELVRVNPGLGEYFGTAEGLLVVDVGADTTLGLRAGDVILSISGRRPTSPAHAMRILGTYEGGEAVQFEVMRSRRRANVAGRMPQRHVRWRVEHNSFEMPHLEPLMRLHELEGVREHLEGLPERLQRELPRLREHLIEPRIRMRRPGEVPIEQGGVSIKTDGWT